MHDHLSVASGGCEPGPGPLLVLTQHEHGLLDDAPSSDEGGHGLPIVLLPARHLHHRASEMTVFS